MGNTMEKINRIEKDDEDDYDMQEDMNEDSKSVELQTICGKGNAKNGQKNPYLKWKPSTVFETVMCLCAYLE